jgi:hypothetical protein
MNRKTLGFLVSLLAFAMLGLPISTALATKPELIVFYQLALSGTGSAVSDYAGNSDNYFQIFTGVHSEFYWDWDGASLSNSMGEGDFDGLWVLHGYVDMFTYGSRTGHGTTTIVVTNWGDGGETGNIVIKTSSGLWHIISGTIGGRKVHGEGEQIFVGVTFPDLNMIMKYEGTIHFDA